MWIHSAFARFNPKLLKDKKKIMPKVAIITDTDSSLPPQVAAKSGIYQVPISIHFDGKSYSTGLDINDRLLFNEVDHLNRLPTTSAPNPTDYIKAYETAFKQGAEEIVCVCVSSKISATYSSALTARENFPERGIRVVDSLNLTMAQGFMVLAAAEAASKNASSAEIVTLVEETGKKIHTFVMLPTLKYLALGGRVDKKIAMLADTINIKPILTVRDGKLDLFEKVRTHKKAVERLLALVANVVQDKNIVRLAVIHVNEEKRATEMESLLRNAFSCPTKITITELTPGLSVHTGSGVVGIVVQTS